MQRLALHGGRFIATNFAKKIGAAQFSSSNSIPRPFHTYTSMSSSMHALVFHGPSDVRYEEVPIPSIEAETDVLVRVKTAAICGSDLHIYNGKEQSDAGTVIGHEVIVVGEAVRGFLVTKGLVAVVVS
eukprot:TRINITY_DN2098_c0_g1_i13.p1 TRINITY_DN2098_c0_g1~~TRINITY_DN2098_c0_g1_i13.p1  ORF type:complete len:128 (-),score=9.66 TRINITY_DN2098_c0_g1_i13:196-579(-)